MLISRSSIESSRQLRADDLKKLRFFKGELDRLVKSGVEIRPKTHRGIVLKGDCPWREFDQWHLEYYSKNLRNTIISLRGRVKGDNPLLLSATDRWRIFAIRQIKDALDVNLGCIRNNVDYLSQSSITGGPVEFSVEWRYLKNTTVKWDKDWRKLYELGNIKLSPRKFVTAAEFVEDHEDCSIYRVTTALVPTGWGKHVRHKEEFLAATPYGFSTGKTMTGCKRGVGVRLKNKIIRELEDG